MLYALQDENRIEASPGKHANCPLCSGEVIAKCGDIKIWHWAHTSNDDCDPLKESESEWHREWKGCFPSENQEVLLIRNGNIHYADVKTDYQMVVEFQHSSLPFEVIVERENFYRFMVWVFDCQSSIERIERSGSSLNWRSPRRDFSFCRQPVFLDFGEEIFSLASISKDMDGQIPVWVLSGDFTERDIFVNDIQSAPRNLTVTCPETINEQGKLIPEWLPYRACQWHRLQKHDRCLKRHWPCEEYPTCQQWKFPFIPTRQQDRYGQFQR